MLLDPELIKKSTFRGLVAALFTSFFYDMLWIYEDTKLEEGAVESSVKSFSFGVSVISMLFRVSFI